MDGLTSVAMRGLMARRLDAAAPAAARGGGTEGSRPKARRACCIAPRVGVPTGIETTSKFEISITYIYLRELSAGRGEGRGARPTVTNGSSMVSPSESTRGSVLGGGRPLGASLWSDQS